jgi:hypothetical protein
MSSNRSFTQRTATVLFSLATATALACGGAATAAADPPGADFDPCANTLAQVTQWPGTLADGSTHVSDAYDSYLGRQPACTSGT